MYVIVNLVKFVYFLNLIKYSMRQENIDLINLDARKYDADVFQVIKFHGNFIRHIKWLDVVSCQ